MTTTPHLEAQDLGFAYRSHGRTSFELSDITVSIPRGSMTGLLGPNGGGKSTLLRMLAGLASPMRGRVLLNGVPLDRLSRREVARRISVVPQSTHPTFDYTAMEMVLMGRHPHIGLFQLEGPDDIDAAAEAMRATDTTNLADRGFLTLSGGEQQRVALASALAQQPEVLLLDEPTASLDIGFQLEIASLLQDLNVERGVTMVIATHDLNLAARLCDRLILVRNGRMIGHGLTSETLTPDAVRALYDVDAEIDALPGTNHRVVVPTRRAR